MNYIFEKGIGIPLCGISDGVFYKFENGEVINNEFFSKFIRNGLNKKTMHIKKVKLIIYKIINNNKQLIGYIYEIDDVSNYLDVFKQPLTKSERVYVINRLMNGYYQRELLWGDING